METETTWLAEVARDFLFLFVTIDPIGTLSLFVALTAGTPPRDRPRVALRAVLWGGAILLGFMALGQIVLNGLGVRLLSFQLAGGIILFLFGLQMVFGTGVASSQAPEPGHDIAVFPLAIPSIAGPGAIMAAVVLTDNDSYSVAHQIETAVVLLVVLALTFAALLAANRIHRVIGDTGANVIVRVMGILLASLATEETIQCVGEIVAQMKAS